MTRGIRCIAHKHSSPAPEEHHHLQPLSRGGKTIPANMVWLCANAHSDAHYFLDLIEEAATRFMIVFRDGPHHPDDAVKAIPWATARTFSPKVREAAITGWSRYGAAFMAGDYAAHSLIWLSSGQPREGLVYRTPFSVAQEWNDVDPMLDRARLHLMGKGDLAGPL
jgi:hypothetical protein